MIGKHPFDGQGFDRQRSLRFWNDIAYDYEGRIMQGTIPAQIVDDLVSKGILDGGDVVEFGCGPGTYSVHLSRHARRLACIDASERMLELLGATCDSEGISNINPVLADFTSLSGKKEYATSVASLCPGAGMPEGIRIMEDFSSGYCVHIMWIDNAWDNLHSKVWKHLGKDYSFESRKENLVSKNLREIGRAHDTYEYSDNILWEIPVGDLYAREERIFSVYGLDQKEVRSALESVLDEFVSGDMFSFSCTNRMRAVIWNSGGAE